MILEGLVTSSNEDGTAHVAPMGPLVDDGLSSLLLRPFQTSNTFRNLTRLPEGVFHVTDDVELLAQAAVGQLATWPALEPALAVRGHILSDACRWYAFRIETADLSEPRARLTARVVDQGTRREFVGFNRGKHAVLEAAILATRRHLIPRSEIEREFARLQVLVDKTGGPQEQRAFAFLTRYVASPADS